MDMVELLEWLKNAPPGTVVDAEYIDKDGVADYELTKWNGVAVPPPPKQSI